MGCVNYAVCLDSYIWLTMQRTKANTSTSCYDVIPGSGYGAHVAAIQREGNPSQSEVTRAAVLAP